MENLINHLQTTWRYWLAIVYFTVLIIIIAAVYNKHKTKPEPEPVVITQPAVPPTVDLEPINRRITTLEQELAGLTTPYQTLKYEHDALYATNQRLERRIQSHTEAFKRLCEYVMVITIDKKLVTRQCLPEYRWSREEGN